MVMMLCSSLSCFTFHRVSSEMGDRSWVCLRPTQPGYPSVCRSNEMVMVIAREEMVSSTLCPKKVVHKTRGENFVNS